MGHHIFSVVIRDDDNTRVEDIGFSRHPQHRDGLTMYNVWLGDQKLGTVSCIDRGRGWKAVSYRGYDKMTRKQFESLRQSVLRTRGESLEEPEEGFREETPNRQVEGFLSRRAAAQYLVRHWGYWGDHDDD